MLEKLKKSLEDSIIIKKNDYNYFVNPICDGVPAIEPDILDEITDHIIDYYPVKFADKIVCVEAMGIPLAAVLSIKTGIPFVVIRKREYNLPNEMKVTGKTGYSVNELYINDIDSFEEIFLIDDVLSTGGTLLAIMNELLETKCVNIFPLVVVCKNVENLKKIEHSTGIRVYSLVDIDVNKKVVIK